VSAARPHLRALAARAGIADDWLAGDGRRHFTSDATRERLLAALGHDAGSESAARAALEALDAREAARWLEPVRVAAAGSRAARALRVRVGAGAPHRVEWSLELLAEDGSTTRAAGTAAPRAGALELRLPGEPALGWHRLRLRLALGAERCEAEQRLVLAPARALELRERLGRRRGFGLWTHLYALRSRPDWGAGDLGELARLLDLAGAAGAAFVGIEPLHATALCPYAPVSRLYRDPLYLEIEAVPELPDCPEARARIAAPAFRAAREARHRAPRVDRAGVVAAKREVLALLHAAFAARQRGRPTPRGRAYAAWREREGRALGDFAAFQALAELHGPDWRVWPEPLRDARSPAVLRFVAENAEAVDLHAWVQFELDRQLGACAARARAAGLALGILGDLAVGTAPGGADTWMFRDLFAHGASVGAPPDAFAPHGQDWATPPADPARLAADAYATFARLLRRAFTHCGALRVDHVMGLERLWWIPAGRPAHEGAYVAYPVDDLLGVLALESRRAGAVVVGEDLGTLPQGFPGRLARRGILSSRVLYFERRGAAFRPARDWSPRALAVANTHDLPPLAGYFAGADLALRRGLGEIASDAALARARRGRAADARALARRLSAERLLPRGARLPAPPALAAAVTAFLCRTPAPLVGIALDDLVGESEPLNLPGVSADRHPSWTRRLRVALEDLPSHPGVEAGLAAVPAVRRSGHGGGPARRVASSARRARRRRGAS
jgi:4-alpha-glucanotransferase